MQTSTLSLGHFFITLKEIVFILPLNFPIVMLGYFNGNMFNDKSKDAQNPILLMSNTRRSFNYNKTLQFMVHSLIMFGKCY
jgi:arginyl-tRNA--protein-N-Asp/Glu arginylyltransferase